MLLQQQQQHAGEFPRYQSGLEKKRIGLIDSGPGTRHHATYDLFVAHAKEKRRKNPQEFNLSIVGSSSGQQLSSAAS